MIDVSEGRPAEILLVEDDDTDVVLTRESFAQAKLAVNMHRVDNGERCLSFLRKQGEYAGVPTPDLVLLDLNLPVMNGREVLAEIVDDEALRHLPVVVLTTSDDEDDVRAMYALRCSSYITKPVDFEKFRDTIREITNHWFTVVVLPTRPGEA